MANYYCTSRTNYFRVKDTAAFEAWAKKWRLEIIKDRDGRVGLLPGDYTDSGEFPSFDNETEEWTEFTVKLSEFLADGSIAIVVEAGNEKMRYVSGTAIAIDSKGQSVGVSLQDIYQLAEENLTGEVTRAEY